MGWFVAQRIEVPAISQPLQGQLWEAGQRHRFSYFQDAAVKWVKSL